MEKTKIDWCDSTWNPVTGCRHACEYCYARGIARRFGKMIPDESGQKDPGMHRLEAPIAHNPYPYLFEPTFHTYRLDEFAKKKKSRNIFVGSMTDLFGDWVPDDWISDILSSCKKAPHHNYLFLTKNVKRYKEYGVPEEAFLWYGTTVTKEAELAFLLQLPENSFVSIEPLLGDLHAKDHEEEFSRVRWVIIGAETGNRKNKVIPEEKWIWDIVDVCKKNKIPVFMKSSLSGIWDGGLIQEFPEKLKKIR